MWLAGEMNKRKSVRKREHRAQKENKNYPILPLLTTLGQETRWAYSNNPEHHTGPTNKGGGVFFWGTQCSSSK